MNPAAYVSAWPELRLRDLLLEGPVKPRPYPLSAPRTLYSYVARSAIYHLFRALVARGDGVVLVPSYHHGNEIRAIRAAGAELRFYPVRKNLEPDWEALEKIATPDCRVLFVIHYIGFPQDMEAIDAWRRKRGLVLVEDCALAFLSETHGQSVGSFGDYSIFCLYKSVPVPNGGLLVENGRPLTGVYGMPLRRAGRASVAGRTLELLLEGLRMRHPRAGAGLAAAKRAIGALMDTVRWRRVPIGDSSFDTASADLGMSGLSRRLLRRFDFASVKQRRRQNFTHLAERLAGRATPLRERLDNGACPLFFPILVPDKARAARALRERGIGAVELWNEGDPECAGGRFPETDFLRRHVLELPLHQSLTEAQLDYMADEVARL